jgi:hypothetical protein
METEQPTMESYEVNPNVMLEAGLVAISGACLRRSHGSGSRGGKGSNVPKYKGMTPQEAEGEDWSGFDTYSRKGRGDWGKHGDIGAGEAPQGGGGGGLLDLLNALFGGN